jgi:hypothetical protein
MSNRSRGDWLPIDVKEYIKLVGCRIRVIWLGKFFEPHVLEMIFQVNGIQARTCRLHSAAEWLNFIDSCYSLGCAKESDNRMSINSQKQSFPEWMATATKDPTYFEFDETKFVDPVFCTVFDTQRNKRLIVDGLHRANALTLACNKGKENFKVVSIVECFGDRVDIIYPCDIHQLPSK